MSANKKSIFITCQGTRGDVQPYVNLGLALIEDGWSVLIGAPEQFRNYVNAMGLEFIDIGPAPSLMYENTVSDEAYRSKFMKPFAAYSTAKDLFNPRGAEPFTAVWFRRILETCRSMRPDVLVLVFTSWCGAAAIPALLNLPTRVVVSYPMPVAPTSAFGVSMAGTGFSLRFPSFNRWQWAVSERVIVQGIHLKAARRNIATVAQEEAAAGRPLPGAGKVFLDSKLNTGDLPHIFAYSSALLPKPNDWPTNYYVVGQLQHRRASGTPHRPLPPHIQAYLDDCRNANAHVIYIGFGSLGFFSPERATAILDAAAAAVTVVARDRKVRALIQTTLSSTPGKTGSLTTSAGSNVPYFTFSESVEHSALFPQTSLVVSHGGIGTVQAALAAGKPVLSVCCLPTADQSFWADLCSRRRFVIGYCLIYLLLYTNDNRTFAWVYTKITLQKVPRKNKNDFSRFVFVSFVRAGWVLAGSGWTV